MNKKIIQISVLLLIILLVSASGIFFYTNSFTEDPNTDENYTQNFTDKDLGIQIEENMPHKYMKSAEILIQRELENQPNVTEEIKINSFINTKENISRTTKIEIFRRDSYVLDKEEKIEYVISNNNATYYYPNKRISETADIPQVQTSKIADITPNTTLNGSMNITSKQSHLIGFSGYDITDYTSSKKFKNVTYDIKINSIGQIKSYNITAESNSENIRMNIEYNYLKFNISSVDPIVTDGEISYNYEQKEGLLNIYSKSLNKNSTIMLRDNTIELSKNENIQDTIFDIITIKSEQGSSIQEHLISDDVVIRFSRP